MAKKGEVNFDVTLADIQEARREIRKYLPPSPLLRSAWLSESLGCELHLKLENMQPIGSFKIRGAINRLSRLSARERRNGVIAASAGNHAQGVAWASRRLDVGSLIVMPRTAPLMKVLNTRALGAEVLQFGDSYQEAFEEASRIARKSGKLFIHAFQDPAIIAGQGTVALELLEQLPELEVVVSSIGGGGLLAGMAVALSELRPRTKLWGCQAVGAPAMAQAIRRGKAVSLDRVDTFADGIAVGRATEPMRRLLAHRIEGVLQADDEAIAAAILALMEKAKVVSEGAGALPLAVMEQLRKRVRGRQVVLVVSGGNIDVNVLGRIIDRGLIRGGRRLRVNVMISDRPGSLARLTELLAKHGANVIQAIHDRSEPSTTIDQTEVALTLETRGPEHSAEVIAALKRHVLLLVMAH